VGQGMPRSNRNVFDPRCYASTISLHVPRATTVNILTIHGNGISSFKTHKNKLLKNKIEAK